MAPNSITGLGFLCVVFNLLTMFYFAPDMTAVCPSWAYFSFAIGLFVYQSMDAIDGKQARRTGTSGPLGELFDHGCDALNTTLEVILAANALQLGQSWWSVLSHLVTLGNFYLSTWEEYHTGTLYLSAFSGPVEGIIIIVLLYLITAFAGAQLWLQTIRSILGLAPGVLPFIPDMQLNHFFIAFGAVGLGGNILTAFQHVVKARRDKKQSVGPALAGLVPFVGMSLVAYSWLNASPYIITEHLVPWMLYVGLSFGYTVGLMITAHVTHQPFPLFNISFLPLIFGAVNANLPALGVDRIFGHHQENIYLWSCLAFSAAAYAHFAVNVVNDICDYFDIWCFTIKHPKKSE
ncbi:MAG: Choline/ethanolaminephosphotransferase [Benniella sp.]|nr:MAG: Choline/ethanolaminephosphotransferase [Benniella sp.]